MSAVEASIARIQKAVALRLEYDAAVRDRYENADAAKVAGEAAGAWIDAENKLSIFEYTAYQNLYRKKEGTP